jgi:hypothetical protein
METDLSPCYSTNDASISTGLLCEHVYANDGVCLSSCQYTPFSQVGGLEYYRCTRPSNNGGVLETEPLPDKIISNGTRQ